MLWRNQGRAKSVHFPNTDFALFSWRLKRMCSNHAHFSHRHADRKMTARCRAKIEISYNCCTRAPILREGSVHCAARKNATHNSGVPIEPSSGRQFRECDRPYDGREQNTKPHEAEKKRERCQYQGHGVRMHPRNVV